MNMTVIILNIFQHLVFCLQWNIFEIGIFLRLQMQPNQLGQIFTAGDRDPLYIFGPTDWTEYILRNVV
jgi:hypothetical protein